LKKIFFKQFGLLHEKNSFAEVRKKLGKFEHNFIGSSKLYKIASNYIGHPNWLLEYQNFLLIMLRIRNYFDGPTKLFSDLHLVKFLDQHNRSF